MNNIKTFFKTIGKSVYSPAWYAHIPKKSGKSAVGYFVLVAVLATILMTIMTASSTIDSAHFLTDQVIPRAISTFPQDLVVTVNKGTITTNTHEPRAFAVAEGLNADKTLRTNIVVIETKTPFTIAAFEKYDTMVWVGGDFVATIKSNGQFQLIPASRLPDMVVSQDTIHALYVRALPYLAKLPVTFVIFLASFFFAGALWNLVWAFLLALLVWLIGSVFFKIKMSYTGAYRITLYAMTLGLFITVLQAAGLPDFIFLFSIITLIVASINLYKGKQHHVTHVHTPEQIPTV